MKKLFAVLMVAVMMMAMAVTAFADDVEILTGTNGTIDLSAYENGTLTVTVKRETGDKTELAAGWGIGGLCFGENSWSVAEGWEALLETTPAVGDVLTFQYDIAAVKAAANGQPVQVNFYNDFVVVNVVVSTGSNAGDATPVVAVAIMAMISCAAVVVLRKKEA